MKKLFVIGALVGLSACTAADQKKVNSAVDLVECKVEVLLPYVDRLTSEEFLAAVAEKDYFATLGVLGVEPAELKATVEALKACHK